MLAYRYPIIAREGWVLIAVVALAALVAQVLLGWLALPLWLLVLVLLFLFRDPTRKIPASPLGVVSPVDGVVEKVTTVQDAYLERQAICLSIRMSITSVYSIHSPMEGKIIEQWFKVPSRIVSEDRQLSRQVDTYAQWIQSDEQDNVVLVMEGTANTRPQCYAHSGERVGQGQRCGFIRFGSLVHVLLPLGTRIAVAEGDSLLAGANIIATLVHADASPPQIEPATI